MSLLLSCAAALALGCGLTIYDGLFVWSAMLAVTLAVLLSVFAALTQRPKSKITGFNGTTYAFPLLVIGTLGSLIWMTLYLKLSLTDGFEHAWLQRLHILALLFVLIHVGSKGQRRTLVFAGLVGIFAITGCLVIHAIPIPRIDTWYFQQAGAMVLGQGNNPYEAAFPIPYTPGEIAIFYGPGMVENGHLMSYCYPPLNLLFQLPFFRILGDIRYAILFGVILSALFIRWLAPSHNRAFAELAVLFMMFEPATLFVIRQAWTEPIVLAFWSAALLATRKALLQSKGRTFDFRQPLAGIMLGLLAAIKQYSPVMLVPPLLQTALLRRPKQQVLIAALAAAITIVPFLFWHFREFIRDVVVMQFHQPFRLDALSLLTVIARLRHVSELPAVALVPAFLLPYLLFILVRPTLGRMDQIASTSAAGFIVFVFLNKQSFCNYYWLALGLLCAACAFSHDPLKATRG